MPRTPSVQKIPGYGADLRSKLERIGMTQVELARTAGVSRQTISRALANDEISVLTQRRIEQSLSRRLPIEARAHARVPGPWARGTDLENWAYRRDAQHELPAIIRALIRLTAPGLKRLEFRSGEGVQIKGWDGRVAAEVATPFVPVGESGWEISTATKIAEKAQGNYEKRTADPVDLTPQDSTFVFVTLRRWPNKAEWARDRKLEGRWRDVRVIDADDLEQWLQDAPSVHLKVSRLIGTFPAAGAQDFGYWWGNWTHATRPPLTERFLLAGRDDGAKRIVENLQAAGAVFGIKSESRAESIAVLAAAIRARAGDDSDAFERVVIVEDEVAWRSLITSTTRLILVPTFEVGDAVAAAQQAGHVVVLPLGENDPGPSTTIAVGQVARTAAAAELIVREGLSEHRKSEEERRADELAKLARRSMTALRRHIAVASQLQRPSWARPENARRVLPALFAGSWNASIPGDRAFLAKLAKKPYEVFAEELEPFINGTDPALRRREPVWYLVSRQDAWDSLAKFVSDDDVSRFRSAAVEVLSAISPVYEMPREERWLAGMSDKKPANSGLLRSGITQTLALVGARADAGARIETGAAFGGSQSLAILPQRVLDDVFKGANRDWKVWATLADVLPDLAEASPDVFLSALDDGLRADPSPIMALFAQESEGMFGGPSPHTGLLWALERLAWSPSHFGHVVRILAELAKRDPGGRLGNRPKASLESIYRAWLPQTSASLDRRFEVLDALANTHEDVVWSLLISTLPEFGSVGSYSDRPHWREWESSPPPVKRGEYAAAVRGAVQRLLKLAGRRGERWAALVDALPHLDRADFDLILDGVSALEGIDESDRASVADSLRKLVASHRNHPSADWALSEQLVDRIDTIRSRFDPHDMVERHRWLFTWFPHLPKPTSDVEDFRAQEEDVLRERINAVTDVYKTLGSDGLLRLAAGVEQPHAVGYAVAKADLLANGDFSILTQHLGSAAPHASDYARGFAVGRLQVHGIQWISSTLDRLSKSFSPVQKATLLELMESEPKTWALAASFGAETERAYWLMLRPFVRDEVDVDEAAQHFMRFGRLFTAAHLLSMYSRKGRINPATGLAVLRRIMVGEGEEQARSDFRYDLTAIIKQLYDSDVARSDIAQIEWGFLPVLEHNYNPEALHDILSREPEFFVELVKHAFRGEDDPPKEEGSVTAEERERATRAYSLLHSWRSVPGRRADRSVDVAELMAWVTSARALLEKAQRSAIGDQLIGQMLSGAPSDPDGTWPCAAVREVIENVASEELERGLAIGKYNSRGVISRAIGAGGQSERSLAEHYETLATAVADSSLRTARMLRSMAEDYHRDANREDRDAALEDDLGRW
jgi:transcriptional regulator with XRE-family HTH domain